MRDIKNQPLFSIVFEDGSCFIGGNSYFQTKWMEIPNKPIKRIFYLLPNGDYLSLSNYESYFHMIEAVEDVLGKTKGRKRIEYAYIMGKKENLVRSYRITLFETKNSRYKIGDIVVREFDINDKFIKGLNFDNWKPLKITI